MKGAKQRGFARNAAAPLDAVGASDDCRCE